MPFRTISQTGMKPKKKPTASSPTSTPTPSNPPKKPNSSSPSGLPSNSATATGHSSNEPKTAPSTFSPICPKTPPSPAPHKTPTSSSTSSPTSTWRPKTKTSSPPSTVSSLPPSHPQKKTAIYWNAAPPSIPASHPNSLLLPSLSPLLKAVSRLPFFSSLSFLSFPSFSLRKALAPPSLLPPKNHEQCLYQPEKTCSSLPPSTSAWHGAGNFGQQRRINSSSTSVW